jgi:hypothetical protein
VAEKAQDFFQAMGALVGTEEFSDDERAALANYLGIGPARVMGVINDEWVNTYFDNQMSQVREYPSFAGSGEVISSRSFCPCKAHDRVVVTGYSEEGMRAAIAQMDKNGIDPSNRIVPVSIMAIDAHEGVTQKAVIDVADIDDLIAALQEAKAASSAAFAAVTGVE